MPGSNVEEFRFETFQSFTSSVGIAICQRVHGSIFHPFVRFIWYPWPKFEMFGGQRVCSSIGCGSLTLWRAMEFIQSVQSRFNKTTFLLNICNSFSEIVFQCINTGGLDVFILQQTQFRDLKVILAGRRKVFLFFSDCQIET